jgi:hypothetical protein
MLRDSQGELLFKLVGKNLLNDRGSFCFGFGDWSRGSADSGGELVRCGHNLIPMKKPLALEGLG